MYSHPAYGAGPLSNNPFLADPDNTHTRFPDISSTTTTAPFQGAPAGQYVWSSTSSASPMAYVSQPQSPGSAFGPPSFLQTQPSFDTSFQLGQQPFAAASPTTLSQPFQPSSAFGQQLVGGGGGAPHLSGSSYGYLQPGGGGGTASLSLAQQQTRSNPGYVAQFDPYASIGQGWDGSAGATGGYGQQLGSPTRSSASGFTSPTLSTTSSSLSSSSTTTTAQSQSQNHNQHPREYVRRHKSELDSWDTYAWKQLFNAFDALKDAWAARTRELRGLESQVQNHQAQYAAASGPYFAGQVQQELGRVQSLIKDANSNADSVAASLFQMKEVYAGYRQSGDPASKRRVREACNAALNGLPEWPQQ